MFNADMETYVTFFVFSIIFFSLKKKINLKPNQSRAATCQCGPQTMKKIEKDRSLFAYFCDRF